MGPDLRNHLSRAKYEESDPLTFPAIFAHAVKYLSSGIQVVSSKKIGSFNTFDGEKMSMKTVAPVIHKRVKVSKELKIWQMLLVVKQSDSYIITDNPCSRRVKEARFVYRYLTTITSRNLIQMVRLPSDLTVFCRTYA